MANYFCKNFRHPSLQSEKYQILLKANTFTVEIQTYLQAHEYKILHASLEVQYLPKYIQGNFASSYHNLSVDKNLKKTQHHTFKNRFKLVSKNKKT